MRPDWQVKALGEFADCCLGKMLDKAKNRGMPQPYLRNVNVRWFDFNLEDVLEMRFEEGERERYTARKGDLLICEGGYPGRAAIWNCDEPIYFQKAVHRVRFHDAERARWVLYFLWASHADGSLERHFTGSGIQHLTGQALSKLRIPLPPLKEQRRIVAVLDEAFAAIDTAAVNTEKSLVNAQDLLLSCLDNLLGRRTFELEEIGMWTRAPLGEICEVLDRLRKPITKSDRRPGPYPYYGATGIVDHVDNYIFEEPLVLLGEDGAKWAAGERSAFVATGKYWVNNHAHVLRPNREVLADDWLVFYLNMTDLMPYISGVTVPKLNQERMRSIPIPVPPLATQIELQNKMNALSDGIDELTGLNKAKIRALNDLKQSLLQRAFSGELTELELVAA